ncbi:MAG: DUF502 domain-containing protein [candidate division Zixibacteria bacterium]|nr:DUF502 domain-containing protein [candidate division Zixibacteria bacterium]
MPIWKTTKDILRRQFLSGVLVVVPLILTYVVLRFLFEAVDGILSPLVLRLFGYNIPGLGIIATILIILLTGFLTRNIIGSTLFHFGDRMLGKMPIIRIIYLAAKQLIEAVTIPNVKAFREVVMIEYPRNGLYAIGFVTTHIKFKGGLKEDEKLIGVFIPSTPTPMTGIVIFIAEEEVTCLNISVEEGLKLAVSGGIVSPGTINRSAYKTNSEE